MLYIITCNKENIRTSESQYVHRQAAPAREDRGRVRPATQVRFISKNKNTVHRTVFLFLELVAGFEPATC